MKSEPRRTRAGHAWPHGDTTFGTCVAVVGALIVVGVVLVVPSDSAVTSAAMVLTVGLLTMSQVQLLRSRSGFRFPLPAVAITVINIVGVTGFVLYPMLEQAALVSARLPYRPEVYEAAALVFATASGALFAGGMIFRGSWSSVDVLLGRVMRGVRSPALIGASAVPMTLQVAAYGIDGLLARRAYTGTVDSPILSGFGNATAPAAVGLLAFLFYDRERRSARPVVLALLVGYFLLLFSVNTRGLALFPALMAFGYLQQVGSDGSPRAIRWPAILALGGLTVLLLQTQLTLRPGPQAGLVPYVQTLVDDPWLLGDISLAGVFGNVLFSVPLAGFVVLNPRDLPVSYLLTSLNPLPGGSAGWSHIQNQLRVNGNTPFSGLGELALHGWPALFFVLFGASILLSYLQRAAQRTPGAGKALLNLCALGMTIIFTLDLLQYNLRSGIRILYYLLALVVVVRVSATLMMRARSRHREDHLTGLPGSGARAARGTRTASTTRFDT